MIKLRISALALVGCASVGTAQRSGPAYVDISWLSVTNIYYEVGTSGVLTDGYISRIPRSVFHGGGGGLAQSHAAQKPDVAMVTRVLDALGGPPKVGLLLAGHSHFDHTFDTAVWSRLTGARVIGSKTTCYQLYAQDIPRDRCSVVNGTEKIAIADGVTMYVVRWNHSGDPAVNPEQHNPVELDSVPRLDPATGGLRPGVAEDFPNGGGNRAFLFVVDGPEGRFSWFFQNSASVVDLETPIVVDGVNYGAPLANLKAGMAAAGLTSVDLWIGSGGRALGDLVLPVIKPKAFLPVHWDDFYAPFLAGVSRPYSDAAFEGTLSGAGIKLVRPAQYMDKWRLSRSGIHPIPNVAVKAALGFAP